jgi:diguanylate cyclase (GGDEF)-like protein
MFVRSACTNGELVQRLASADAASPPGEAAEPPRWLLPVRVEGRTRGLIVAAEFESSDWHDETMLRLAGRILESCWTRVQQDSELRVALQTDQVSGVLNRADLSERAEQVLRAADDDGEPVVLMVLGIEGLRRLDDGRQWELHNWLMQQVGQTLRRKLRSDDIVGRFSDDRFVAVMRRLDLGLGRLIARKTLSAVGGLLTQGDPVLASAVRLRCGLSGDSSAGFEMLLGRACDALQQARTDGVDLMVCGASKSAVPLVAGAAT